MSGLGCFRADRVPPVRLGNRRTISRTTTLNRPFLHTSLVGTEPQRLTLHIRPFPACHHPIASSSNMASSTGTMRGTPGRGQGRGNLPSFNSPAGPSSIPRPAFETQQSTTAQSEAGGSTMSASRQKQTKRDEVRSPVSYRCVICCRAGLDAAECFEPVS